MSVDVLQEKIRKTKNPSILMVEAFSEWIPAEILQDADTVLAALECFYSQLFSALKGCLPGVRFGFGSFALLGGSGIDAMYRLMACAKELGFYVIMDAPEMLSTWEAENALNIWQKESKPLFDGLVVSGYLGSDIYKTLLPLCRMGKALFPVVRTANKSAAEIQDLLTGARLVHTASADVINRSAGAFVGKCGYSQIGALAAASSADSLRSLRSKYSQLFFLLDGYDYPNANAKYCSFAFDKLGHGAAACAGSSIASAWKESSGDVPWQQAAVMAADRIRKNLTRYVTVL